MLWQKVVYKFSIFLFYSSFFPGQNRASNTKQKLPLPPARFQVHLDN